ncbi:MAG: glycosyltransferase family 2 protein [Cellulomonadaceae bacterium]|nr:glycosyltransferase family 2 protein [Cellulomonadaceae bacterium]
MTDQLSESLVVAVLTYRRPGDLADVLPLLVAQAREVSPTAHVLVVDNDPDASAADLVSGFAAQGVRYVCEPVPGIAAARNRALAEAGTDLLVFIDDDERPEPGWLGLLVGTWLVDRPAAVVGPVVSRYEVDPEPWVTDGRFFDRRRLPTGTVVDVAATNNLLLDLRVLRALDLRFDVRFGLSGGSDTLFTRQLVRAGERIVWCDEAVVLDVVPAARVTRAWVLQRAYRSGNGWSRTSLEMATSPVARVATRLECSARGVVRLAGGGARWVAGTVLRSQGQRARGTRTVMRGAGLVSGAWGSVYSEYRRT